MFSSITSSFLLKKVTKGNPNAVRIDSSTFDNVETIRNHKESYGSPLQFEMLKFNSLRDEMVENLPDGQRSECWHTHTELE